MLDSNTFHIPPVKLLGITATKFLLKSREYSTLKNWKTAYEYLEKSYRSYINNQLEKSEDIKFKIFFDREFYILGKNLFFEGDLLLATKCFNYMQEIGDNFWGRNERFPKEKDLYNKIVIFSDLGNPFIYLSAINAMTNKIEDAISNLRSIKTYYESDAVPLSITMSLLKGEHFFEALDIVFEFEKNLVKKCAIRKYLLFLKELYTQLCKEVIDIEKVSDTLKSNISYLEKDDNLVKAIFDEEIEFVFKELKIKLYDPYQKKEEIVKIRLLPIPIKLNEVISRIDETKKRPDYWLNLHNVVIKRLYDIFSETDLDFIRSNDITKSGEFIPVIDPNIKRGITYYRNCGGTSFLNHLRWEINNRLQEKIAEIKYHKELEIKEELARQAKAHRLEKERMIQQYSHALANTLNPNTIYEVANRLKKHSEFRKDACFLTDAYHAETLIRNQGLLLQARNTGSSSEFQQLIRGDRLPEETKEKAIGIDEILNNAIERIVARFLNADYRKLELIREQICTRRKTTLSQMKADFEENVFFNPNRTAVEWANANIGSIDFTISPFWNSIRLRRDGYAEALLQGYFQELLFNALKYRDSEEDIWVDIRFYEEEIESRTFIVCDWENPYTQNVSISTGKGLEGIQNDLEMLNYIRGKNVVFTMCEKGGKFRVTLRFLKDIFVPYKPKTELDSELLAKHLKKEKNDEHSLD